MTDTFTAREADILDRLRTAKSINELAQEIGVGYHTVGKEVRALAERGYLKVLPWKAQGGKSFLYQSVWANEQNPDEPQEMLFVWVRDAIAPKAIIKAMASAQVFKDNAQDVAGILAHLIIRSYYKIHGHEGMMPHPDEVEAKKYLVKLRDYFSSIVKLIDQLLAAPIWGGYFANHVGDLTIEEVVEVAERWEARWAISLEREGTE